jgi:hypothetical protein
MSKERDKNVQDGEDDDKKKKEKKSDKCERELV